MAMAIRWNAGKCFIRGCPFTLVMYIGGGMHCCWLHALRGGFVDAMMKAPAAKSHDAK